MDFQEANELSKLTSYNSSCENVPLKKRVLLYWPNGELYSQEGDAIHHNFLALL